MSNVKPWQEEYLTLIEDCENREERLNDWERKFIAAIKNWIEGDRVPTPKQIEILDGIWERVTRRG